MLWSVVLACLAVLLISFPGHLVLDRLWALAFNPLLAALFRNRRRSASLQVMWLDFINMCATVFLALLSGLLILGKKSPTGFCWIPVGVAALTSAVVVAIVSTRRPTEHNQVASRVPATPMMMAGSLVAILLGVIFILARA
jgi:hypothetical protein